MNKVILLGPPGSGKGTQAARICQKMGIGAIATGEMLREEIRTETDLGREANRYLEAGELVPDSTVIAMVEKRLGKQDCAGGFLLDGFPRTIPQAKALGEIVAIDCVVEIRCEREKIIKRLCGRRIHPGSGRTYHVDWNPPQNEGLDDETGEPLVQRVDDEPETVIKRLEVYEEQTRQLVDYYAAGGEGMPAFRTVDGDQDIDAVTADLLAALQ